MSYLKHFIEFFPLFLFFLAHFRGLEKGGSSLRKKKSGLLEKLAELKNFYCPCCDKEVSGTTGDFIDHLLEHNKRELVEAIARIIFELVK